MKFGVTRCFDATPETFTTDFGIAFRRVLYPLLKPLLKLSTKRKIIVEQYPRLAKGKPYIFASTHYFDEDIIANLCTLDRNAWSLAGSTNQIETNPLMFFNWLTGIIYVDRQDPKNRKDSIKKMERVLSAGSSVILFPEGGWNKTSERLVLDFWKGVYMISSAVKCDVVPIIHYVRDMEILNKKNIIHTVIDDPIPLYEMPEKEALTYLREVMASWQWKMMERYGVSTREQEMQGFDTSAQRWHKHLQERMKGVSRYDSSIEKCADYRPKDIIRPEDVFSSIAQINDITPYNAEAVIYAQRHIKEIKENDFQRLY